MDFLNKQSCRDLCGELARTIERPLRACALSILVAAGIAGPCAAQSDAQTAEYRVKAAFLYKFGGYVEWPQGVFAKPDSPIAIGVIGADALAEELARIVAGRTINFVVVEDKVRFDIAPPPSESSNLKISARLLGVARKVVSKSS